MTAAPPLSPSSEVKLDEDEEIPPPAPKVKSKPPSRAGSAIPPKRASSRSKRPAKSKALFLDSDDDVKDVVVEEESHVMDLTLQEEDEDQTLRSSAGSKPPARSAAPSRKATRQPARGKKAMPVIVDDDSDDGAVFKGFRGNKKR